MRDRVKEASFPQHSLPFVVLCFAVIYHTQNIHQNAFLSYGGALSNNLFPFSKIGCCLRRLTFRTCISFLVTEFPFMFLVTEKFIFERKGSKRDLFPILEAPILEALLI